MSSKQVFQLYVIHTDQLALRKDRLKSTVQFIRKTVETLNYEFRLNMVTSPTVVQVQQRLSEIEKRIKYEKVGIPEFDNNLHNLTVESMSNYERQREIWKRIMEEANNDIFMVIEDDCFVLSDNLEGFKEIVATTTQQDYDFISLSLSKDSHEGPLEYLNIRDSTKILPSKDAYIISKRGARIFYEQSDTIKFSMRYQMSYILHNNPGLRALYPTARVFLEGSKVGMYPSSINPNNILIYNKEYMELFHMLQQEEIDPRNVRKTYRNVAQLNSPDILHLYGVLLFKAKEVKEAQDALLEAVDLAKKQGAILNSSSDLLNNTINIHEHTQWDLPDIMRTPSRYTCKQSC